MTERLYFHFSLSCIGEGNGNPLQYSCLENPRDGGAWWAAAMWSLRVGHDWSDLAAAAAAYICSNPSLPIHPTPPLSPLVSICLFSYVCLYLCFANKITYTIFLDFKYILLCLGTALQEVKRFRTASHIHPEEGRRTCSGTKISFEIKQNPVITSTVTHRLCDFAQTWLSEAPFPLL